MAKFKCTGSKSKRWRQGAVYSATPGGGDGCFNVLDEDGAEWTIQPTPNGGEGYMYVKNSWPSAWFVIVVDQ